MKTLIQKDRAKSKAEQSVSRHRKPLEMSLEEWQIALRRQFGESQNFSLRNLGPHPFLSDFEVTNPASGRSYLVSIRGEEPGVNSCGCPDYATNLLGTCKHIEFALAVVRKRRGGKSALRRGFHPSFSSVYLVHGAQRQIRFQAGTEAPAELRRLASRFFEGDGTLRPDALTAIAEFLSMARQLPGELRVAADVTTFIETLQGEEERRRTVNSVFTDGTMSTAFDGLLKTELHPYQREGTLFACRAGRSILADEMGLGKTVQAIAAAEIGARHLGVERVLVVCPASLKHQWSDEIQRFSSRTAAIVYGGAPQRREAFTSPSFFKITGYDTLHTDLQLIREFRPDFVILDEAQRIKNWSTRAARSVKQISSRMALVLTGTPLENRLEELISIVQFVDQHRLGPTYRVLHEHQIREEDTGRVVGYTNLSRLAESLSPILLRRKKSEVLRQLPPRTETRLFIEMTPAQRGAHEQNAEIVAKIVAKWKRFKFLAEADQKRLTITLQNMRMSCDSTFLLDGKSLHGRKATEIATLLRDVLEEPGTKAVVFSQWVRMLDLLSRECRSKRWEHVLFHGGVDTKDRGALVRHFREDPDCRVFLSTDAGGTGLNLQAASVVIHADLPWNPAILEQRAGRVHRLGQKRPVQIYSFIAERTIEQGMLSLIGFKQSLFAGVLDGGKSEVLLGGTRLKNFMESVESATVTEVPAPLPAEPALAVPSSEGSVLPSKEEPEAAPAIEVPSPPETETAAPAEAVTPVPAAVRTEVPPEPLVAAANPEMELPVAELLSLASTFFQGLAAAITPPAGSEGSSPRPITIERDPRSGEAFLRVRLPEQRVLDELFQGLQGLLKPKQ